MFLLRRAASRALSRHATHQLTTLRSFPASRVTFQSAKPSNCIRAFHQSRIWRAEEPEEKAQQLKEESEAAAEIAEEAALAAEAAADEAIVESAASEAHETDPAVEEATEIAEGEAAVAAEAAEIAAAAASTAQSTTTTVQPPASAAPAAARFPPRDAPAASGISTPPPSRILYIGNLFFEVTAAHLEAEFSQFGTVTNSRVVTDARGLSKGFGYVELADQESADRAVRELDQKVFQGRRMAVQYHVRRERNKDLAAENRTPNQPSKTLFIGNMSYQMSDKDLNDLFREIRDVLDVRVAIDRRSGQPRGFAHADFIDVPSAERAKEHLEKKVIYGRQLRVDYSQSSNQVRNS